MISDMGTAGLRAVTDDASDLRALLFARLGQAFPLWERAIKRSPRMKRSRFTDAQVASILKQAAEGAAIADVCRKAGISEATFYAWRKKYAGLQPSKMKRLRQLEEENERLKKLLVDLSADCAMLRRMLLQGS
jgi:putative transposase